MNALLRLQERLLETGALIERYERAMSVQKSTPGVLANLRSLARQRQKLEAEFEAMARQTDVDLFHYRLLPQATDRITISGVAETWKAFQALFSIVHSALRTGPKQRAKLSAGEIAQTSLGFGYSYAGSLGVVLTLPNERLLIGDTHLGLAVHEAFKLVKAKTGGEIAAYAGRLGIPTVRALYGWADSHVKHGFGAAVEWKRQDHEARLSVLAQYQELVDLRRTIGTMSDMVESTFDVEGLLLAADVRGKTFRLAVPSGEDIRGQFSGAIDEAHTVELPKRYRATIRKTTQTQYATEQEKTSHFLVSLAAV